MKCRTFVDDVAVEPIIAQPAATATGCGTPPTPCRELVHPIGSPSPGSAPGCPALPAFPDHVRAMSLTSSPAWWNSVLATDRAGVRMALGHAHHETDEGLVGGTP